MKSSFLFILIVFSVISCKHTSTNTIISGFVFGTSYKVIYPSGKLFNTQIDSLLYTINKSLSTYQSNSVISKINRNEDPIVDTHFINVFKVSKDIYHNTNGAFDPSIGLLVNAWGFGPGKEEQQLDSLTVSRLLQSVNFDKVKLSNLKVIKPIGTYLDFNAIAKGYALDVIGAFLESNAIDNYLIEIGGEIKAKGKNIHKNNSWQVGIDRPNFDGSRSLFKTIALQNEAMATSGTYRKFKVDNEGRKYAHIIDPKTGYPSKTNLLSVSVIANDCMTADAYATAFKTMGVTSTIAFLKQYPELKVMLIYENKESQLEAKAINGFPE